MHDGILLISRKTFYDRRVKAITASSVPFGIVLSSRNAQTLEGYRSFKSSVPFGIVLSSRPTAWGTFDSYVAAVISAFRHRPQFEETLHEWKEIHDLMGSSVPFGIVLSSRETQKPRVIVPEPVISAFRHRPQFEASACA